MGALWAVLLQLLLSAIGIIIINQVIFNARQGRLSHLIEDLKRNLKYVFIESTRALLPILLKCLLFIVPGVIEGIKLYFVPYVAQFDEEYKKGNVDALDRSRALVQNRFWLVTGMLILSLVLSMVPRLYLETIDFAKAPVFYGLIFIISMGLELYSDILLFMVYVRLEESSGNKISLP